MPEGEEKDIKRCDEIVINVGLGIPAEPLPPLDRSLISALKDPCRELLRQSLPSIQTFATSVAHAICEHFIKKAIEYVRAKMTT